MSRPLSPAAQAILEATYSRWPRNREWIIAAALRAAADQVVPEQQIPRGHLVNLGGDTIEVFPQGARIPMQRLRLLQEVRNSLLAIATELETHQ